MESFYFVGFAVGAAFLSALIKRLEPTMAAFLSLGACLMLMIGAGDSLATITSSVHALAQKTPLDSAYISLLLRIVGIAYIAQIGAQACRDAGSANIGDHVDLCARVAILSLSSPLFLSLMEMLTGVLQ